MNDKTDPPGEGPHHDARDARGGEIILRTKTQRIIFIAGLVGLVLIGILGSLLVYL